MIWFFAVVVLAVAVALAIWFLHRFYAKANRETALVRTGLGGQKVVMDGGCLALPILHHVQKVSMRATALALRRDGERSLLTGDRLRADVEMEFEIRVTPTPAGVATAAQALGQRIARGGEAVEELLRGQLVNAMHAAPPYDARSWLNWKDFLNLSFLIATTVDPIRARIDPEQSRIDWNNRPVRVHSLPASGPASLKPTQDVPEPPNDGPFPARSHRQGERAMSPDTIAIVIAILGTGIALAVLIVPSLRELRRDVADLRERMARLEGLFEGFTRRESAPPPA